MAENPITVSLPADLPTNWVYGQTVAPEGSDVGLSQQHGYNYLMQQVNAAQQAAEDLGEAFPGLASLDSNGKVPAEELPEMDYDPAGSAEKVQENLDAHIADKENPHGVKADQVPYDNSRGELQSKNVQGAIDELYARMYGDLKVKVQVYETGTTTPIPGVVVTGIASEIGGVCYADENGIATGYVLSDEQSVIATVKVDDRYIDLTGQTSQQVTVTKGVTANATIYATRVINPSGKIETFMASTQKMFTNKVSRVDVHSIGGGAGGGSGSTSATPIIVTGGYGGGQGGSNYKNSVTFSPNIPFQITVGSKGTGSSPASASSSISRKNGSAGGTSECLGVSASGGSATATSYGVARINYDEKKGENGASNSGLLFGESSSVKFGGSGGGGGAYAVQTGVASTSASSGTGGTPYGGDGGNTPSSITYYNGDDATGIGGGGGGGSGAIVKRTDGTCNSFVGGGGDGYQGAVYVRWFYT